ncbi:olfactory receptor 6N2-like [Cheilinus undulatus]|uniref:olfactory receptor 6N2-like n=1 Tax=Cheilinus undulatus TaxID=241271 RepID=UPI001BD3CFC7|nr:olfactory receptor 6N2-like [Cheilinus undulatus]
MMGNSTQISFFTFTAYIHSGQLKSVYFITVLLLYLFIVLSNVLLVVVIVLNRSLHEPMYMLLCSLFFNELYGSTGLFFFLMVQILSDIHTISPSLCYLQVFCLYSYGGVEFWILTAMSYDRYLSICFPLQYNTRMTTNRVLSLIAVSWLIPFLIDCVLISLAVTSELCDTDINRLYCDFYSIFKLACHGTAASHFTQLISSIVLILCCVTPVLYSYTRIFKVCCRGSKQTRQKAFSTCMPHLASLFNFIFGIYLEGVQAKFDVDGVPQTLRVFTSLYFLICQPLVNPLIYGLKLPKIRIKCKTLIFG